MKPENIAVQAVTSEVTFSKETIEWIREVVTIGLYCLGEVEQILAQKEMVQSMGGTWPTDLDVRHPTGQTDTVKQFADVLMALNC